MRIEGDFRKMRIGIGEIARIAAPKRIVRLLDDAPTGALGVFYQLVDLAFAARVIGEGHAAKSRPVVEDTDVLGQLGTREEAENKAIGRKERDVFRAGLV